MVRCSILLILYIIFCISLHSWVNYKWLIYKLNFLQTSTEYTEKSAQFSLSEQIETAESNEDTKTTQSLFSDKTETFENDDTQSEISPTKHKNEISDKFDNLKSTINRSPIKVELSNIKPFKLIKRPDVEKLSLEEFAFMVRPNERMIGIENFVIPEIEKLNALYSNISAGSVTVEGEGSIKEFKFQNFGHYSFPGYIKDELVSREYYLRTIPYARYIPLFVEVRGSSYNAALHGIYRREDSMQLSQKDTRFPWYVEPLSRPVFRRISSEPILYIFFLNYPIERWCIGNGWPIENPKELKIQIFAELIGRPYSPAFSRGWYVQPRKYGAHDIVPYVELDPSTPLRNPLPVKIPYGMESKRVLVFDKDLIVDEARPFTFIPPESQILEHIPLVESPDELLVFSGCPNIHLSKFTGLTKYNTPTCIPPLRGTLDIVLNGANGYFTNALYSWEGFFKNRPYFVQRGPLRNEEVTLLSSIVEYPGNTLYLWSLHEGSNSTSWFISRQLGNTNPTQILAIWRRPNSSRVKSPTDWPAERGIELEPDGWSFLSPPYKKKYVHKVPKGEYQQEKIFLRINGLKPKNVKMSINGGPEDINGDYFHMGEYLGFPFFRQKRNKKKNHPGYVLYRGIVISRSKDTWVIGTTLGSIHGIKAYAVDYINSSYSNEFISRSGFQYLGGTRWPHQLPIKSWRVWTPSDENIKINIYSKELRGHNSEKIAKNINFIWKAYDSLYITMEYLNPTILFKQHVSPVLGNPLLKQENSLKDHNIDPSSLDLTQIKDKISENKISENKIFEDKNFTQETKSLNTNIPFNELGNDVLGSMPGETDTLEPINEKSDKKNNLIWLGIIGIGGSVIIGFLLWIFIKNRLKKNNYIQQDHILGSPSKIAHPKEIYYSKINQ